MVKHFLISPEKEKVSKSDIISIEETRVKNIDRSAVILEQQAEEILNEADTLKRVFGRVVIKINNQNKNYHTFETGEKIRIERQFNNLNRRITEPVNGIVIDADGIEPGTEILVYYNAIHDSNKIFNYKNKSPYIGYYSIKEEDCYLKRVGNEWQPLFYYEKALRVFEPYKGLIEGMPPTQIKDTLYVLTGELKDNVVKTLRGCDFNVVFQDVDGKEGNIIVFRPFGNPEKNLEEEAIAILWEETQKVIDGELLIGLSVSDCKQFHVTQFHAETF